jgi:predicted enzyme involved in methoxymalonyl-ACP biosynthesis
VQGKFIEQAFFSHLFQRHNRHAAQALWVNFRSTERNAPARQVLEALGFEPCEFDSGGLILHQCDRLSCNFISVICTIDSGAAQLARAV